MSWDARRSDRGTLPLSSPNSVVPKLFLLFSSPFPSSSGTPHHVPLSHASIRSPTSPRAGKPRPYCWHPGARAGGFLGPPAAPFPFQSDEKSCEDLAEDDHYSAPPSSSLSPLEEDVAASTSSLFVDGLTTEGTGRWGQPLRHGHPIPRDLRPRPRKARPCPPKSPKEVSVRAGGQRWVLVAVGEGRSSPGGETPMGKGTGHPPVQRYRCIAAFLCFVEV